MKTSNIQAGDPSSGSFQFNSILQNRSAHHAMLSDLETEESGDQDLNSSNTLIDTSDLNFIYRITDQEMENIKSCSERAASQEEFDGKFSKKDVRDFYSTLDSNSKRKMDLPIQTLNKTWNLCAIFSPEHLNEPGFQVLCHLVTINEERNLPIPDKLPTDL